MQTRVFAEGIGLMVAAAFMASALPALAADQPFEGGSTVGDLHGVGTVYLTTSCRPEVQKDFAAATALLHSFFYSEARRRFKDVAAQDPACAMAQWGIAMTWWHPLWAAPTDEERALGRDAIGRARAIGGQTELERGYIAALDAFYTAPAVKADMESGQSCHGPTGGGDQAARALAYERAMEQLFARYPHDVEVAAFYSLALLGAASPSDKTLEKQRRATAIMEPFYKEHPDHPGLTHYLIHGYDYPSEAAKGLAAAKAYAAIAPWVPHALHMPSHIFTRLGMWTEDIQCNIASAQAARQYAQQTHSDATSFDELHADDYLEYGYLQLGEDQKAKEVVERIRAVRKTSPEIDFVAAYAMGAVPTRYALERKQWAEAANLVATPTASWSEYPFGAALPAFARALGAARSGQVTRARAALKALERIAAGIRDPSQRYFAEQTQAQVAAVKGWLASAEGRYGEAEVLLRAAADVEDALGKHPVSPGALLPVRELLADFLLERGRPAEALLEYALCLSIYPGRLNSTYGAGYAAERSEQPELARRFYADLVSMVALGTTRPEVQHARAYLADATRSVASR